MQDNQQAVTGYASLFELTNIPKINITISGNLHCGKTTIAAKIAETLLKEFGFPINVVSGDGDFISNYARVNGEKPNVEDPIIRRPRSTNLKPVKITIIDDNTPFEEYVVKPHQHVDRIW